MDRKKMIIVTGATGFIGSNLLWKLEQEGFRNIVGIDSFENERKWHNVSQRSYTFFILPTQTFDFLQKYTDSICAIIHLGGISSTTENNINEIVITNIQLTIKLYEFSKYNGIQFIYASSAATYGDGFYKFEDSESLEYLSKLRPLNPYGWSKNCIDKLILKDKKLCNFNAQVVGLKFFNVYGPNEYHKGNQTSVVYSFFQQIE